MTNGKKLLRATVILALVAMIALTLVANTYAKYTSTVSGKDTAIVAKWSVKAAAGSTEFTSGTAATVNIFDESNVYELKDVTDFTAAGTDDADVKNAAANAAAIIAPGTWGKFAFTVSNNSDVSAAYTVALSGDEKNVPLKWSIDDGTTWVDDITTLTKTDTLSVGTTTPQTIEVLWKWEFSTGTSGDTADTTLGTAATLAQPTATVTVTFDQVD